MSRLRPMVCAHRGRSGVYPENTMAAFEAAIELGVDFIECDVHRTSDGRIVVIHDHDVKRTTDGEGPVSEMTFEQVRSLDAGSWKAARFAGERIPTLAEVLERIAPRCVVDIEIKQRGIAGQVASQVTEAGAVRQTTVVSFDLSDLADAKVASPELSCGLITSGPTEDTVGAAHGLISSALGAGCNFITCHHPAVTETLVRECHVAGLVLMAWTMDEPDDIRRMIDMQVDALVSNYPDRVLELL
ncbi:MAG TPA: glycerophosphodiester phosphodiesterase family protein [Armatimonadota bacterium]|nr:glycerophosphodiester phosphodiesterase family protein [Armatimonadota bacterium]